MGNDTTLGGDEGRIRYSLDILEQRRPEFVTIHLSSLDEEEHLHGPSSEEANADLETLDENDRMANRAGTDKLPQSRQCSSDHGFAKVEHTTNLYIPFLEAGLIQAGGSSGAP